MRVFKNKWFNNWAVNEGISDKALLDAAKEIVAGKVNANLGRRGWQGQVAVKVAGTE